MNTYCDTGFYKGKYVVQTHVIKETIWLEPLLVELLNIRKKLISTIFT